MSRKVINIYELGINNTPEHIMWSVYALARLLTYVRDRKEKKMVTQSPTHLEI